MKKFVECPAHDINLSGINTGITNSHVAENLMPGTLHAGEDIEPWEEAYNTILTFV